MIEHLILVLVIVALFTKPARPPSASRLLVKSILNIIDEPLTHDGAKIKAIKCVCQAWMAVYVKQEKRV